MPIKISANKIKDLCNIALDDLKAVNINSFDVEKTSSFASYILVATGTSNRHINAISQSVHKMLKSLNITLPSIEGNQDSGWIVIDSGDVIIHLFKDEIRKFYNLENMWSAEIE